MIEVPATHKLTNSTEVYFLNTHIISRETPGYTGDSDAISDLVEREFILPEAAENFGVSGNYIYIANGLHSFSGLLNSTRVDQKGYEKRTQTMNKVRDFIFNLSMDYIEVGRINGDLSYKDIAFDSYLNPVILPNGIDITETNFKPRENSPEEIVEQISYSILRVIDDEDVRPFKSE